MPRGPARSESGRWNAASVDRVRAAGAFRLQALCCRSACRKCGGEPHSTIPENRYFKYLLLETLRRLQHVVGAHDTGDEDADLSAEQRFFEALRPEAVSMIRRIHGLLRAPFLEGLQAQVPSSLFSPVLYRHPAYAAFVQTARLLNSGLSLQGGALQIGIKNIAQLLRILVLPAARQSLPEKL